MLACEFFGLGCIWNSELANEAQAVNGNEASVALSLDVIAKIGLRIGRIEPSELLRLR